MIREGYDLDFVVVVPCALYLYYFVNRHLCLVLLIAWYCILLFERLEVFYLLMKIKLQKMLQKACVLRLLVCLLVCVLRIYCRFLLRERKEIQ